MTLRLTSVKFTLEWVVFGKFNGRLRKKNLIRSIGARVRSLFSHFRMMDPTTRKRVVDLALRQKLDTKVAADWLSDGSYNGITF